MIIKFDEYNFNFGDCYLFAIALHRMYGYPLYAVYLYYKEDDWDYLSEDNRGYLSEIAHVLVKLSNGNYLDADGEIDEEQLKKLSNTNYAEYITIEPISEFDARTAYLGEDEKETIGETYKEDEIIDVINKLKKINYGGS
jgi:hypothetical protein